MSEKLHFEIIENGAKLRVTPENMEDFKQFIVDHEDDCLTSFNPNTDQAFMELTESYWTNGWGVFTADNLGQLSECLVIAEEATIEDDGSHTLYKRAYYNGDYMIINPLDQILEKGYYDFDLWEDFGNHGRNFPSVYNV